VSVVPGDAATRAWRYLEVKKRSWSDDIHSLGVRPAQLAPEFWHPLAFTLS
jgi:hypothetical protein